MGVSNPQPTFPRYGLKPMYPWGMDKMDATLDLLTPEEIADSLRFVEVWEKAGHMSPEEANEWRTRIEAWQRFLNLPQARRKFNVDRADGVSRRHRPSSSCG